MTDHRRRDSEALVLLFDGTCGLCTRSARLVIERTPPEMVKALPNQTPGLIEPYGLTREDVDRYVWVIGASGRRWYGATAVARLLRAMGGGWWLLGCLGLLPGAGLLYQVVARSRSRLSAAWGDAPPYP